MKILSLLLNYNYKSVKVDKLWKYKQLLYTILTVNILFIMVSSIHYILDQKEIKLVNSMVKPCVFSDIPSNCQVMTESKTNIYNSDKRVQVFNTIEISFNMSYTNNQALVSYFRNWRDLCPPGCPNPLYVLQIDPIWPRTNNVIQINCTTTFGHINIDKYSTDVVLSTPTNGYQCVSQAFAMVTQIGLAMQGLSYSDDVQRCLFPVLIEQIYPGSPTYCLLVSVLITSTVDKPDLGEGNCNCQELIEIQTGITLGTLFSYWSTLNLIMPMLYKTLKRMVRGSTQDEKINLSPVNPDEKIQPNSQDSDDIYALIDDP